MSRGSLGRAERATFLASLFVVLALAGAIVFLWVDGESPASLSVRTDGVRRDGEAFLVDATVVNDGDATAACVQVVATLTIGGEETEAEQVVDFVSGDDSDLLVFVFQDDPADGELELEIASFADP